MFALIWLLFADIYPVMLDDDARYQCQVGPGPQGKRTACESTFSWGRDLLI